MPSIPHSHHHPQLNATPSRIPPYQVLEYITSITAHETVRTFPQNPLATRWRAVYDLVRLRVCLIRALLYGYANYAIQVRRVLSVLD